VFDRTGCARATASTARLIIASERHHRRRARLAGEVTALDHLVLRRTVAALARDAGDRHASIP
jgi:hypothetical protein